MIKYFLIVSAILNSILLMSVLGVVPFLLYLSLLVIVGLIWFVFHLMNKLEDVAEDMEELFVGFYEFSERLQDIHELEMFYGEPVLQELMDHAKKVVEDIEEYKSTYDEGNELEDFASEEEDGENREDGENDADPS
tara:strand:+ start:712 stop:1119 length:408 start_codon:yes stop_codon:yes gene_type:complete